MNTLKIDDRILPYKQFSNFSSFSLTKKKRKLCIYEYGTCEKYSEQKIMLLGREKKNF